MPAELTGAAYWLPLIWAGLIAFSTVLASLPASSAPRVSAARDDLEADTHTHPAARAGFLFWGRHCAPARRGARTMLQRNN